MPRNPYFNLNGITMGSSGEQTLLENLIVEQIKMFGMEVYYIPRSLGNYDSLFGEDAMSRFSSSYQIEAYFPNAEGLEGEGNLYSKFGIRIAEQTTFIIARKRFKDLVDDNTTLIAEGRPNEGDLIYMPLSNDIFEIKFVDHQSPFYPLGKGHVWELRCELFEYSDEQLDTGISEVDEVEDESAYTLSLNMAAGGSGTFVSGQIVTGQTSQAQGTVVSWNSSTRKLVLRDLTGVFKDNEVVKNANNTANWTITILDSYAMDSFEGAMNKYFETKGNVILDFTEKNPFGEIGNMGDRF